MFLCSSIIYLLFFGTSQESKHHTSKLFQVTLIFYEGNLLNVQFDQCFLQTGFLTNYGVFFRTECRSGNRQAGTEIAEHQSLALVPKALRFFVSVSQNTDWYHIPLSHFFSVVFRLLCQSFTGIEFCFIVTLCERESLQEQFSAIY